VVFPGVAVVGDGIVGGDERQVPVFEFGPAAGFGAALERVSFVGGGGGGRRERGKGGSYAKHWFTSFGQSRMEPARNRTWTRSNGVWNVQFASTSSTSNWTFGGTLNHN